MIRSTRISLGLFFNYFLSLTKIDLGQNYISLPSIKSSTHIALLFMASMGTQKLKAQGFFIFSLLLTLILFCITTLYNENTNVKLIPQMNYLMVVVALFFLNAVIFLFMLMKYFTNKQILPTLILSLAFLSGLIYLVETIVIIHKPINGSTLIQTKSNDVSIFYIFRQLSFICLTSLALFCYGKDNILDNNKKKTGILLLALIPFLVFPLLAHNLSSYNADYSLYVVDYCPDNHTATWGINYTKILVCLWAFLLFFIIMRTRLASELWPLIALLCLASLCCNLLLLTLDEYNYTIWYISRGIEVSSKLLAALGFISHNTTVAVSILVLIIVRVTPLSTFFPWIEKQGLSIGIIILTIGVMAPIASGTLPPSTLIHSFLNWKSLVAIAVGVIVSWLGGRGVTLMGSQPQLVAGLLVGTVLGVALFRGVPVGPLIAAGLVSLIVGKQ